MYPHKLYFFSIKRSVKVWREGCKIAPKERPQDTYLGVLINLRSRARYIAVKKKKNKNPSQKSTCSQKTTDSNKRLVHQVWNKRKERFTKKMQLPTLSCSKRLALFQLHLLGGLFIQRKQRYTTQFLPLNQPSEKATAVHFKNSI